MSRRAFIPRAISLALQDQIGRRLFRALAWGGVATLAGRGLPILALAVTARWLGAADFGALAVVLSTVLMLEAFVTAGLAVSCTKFVADFRGSDPGRAGRIIDFASITCLGLGFFVSIALFFSSPLLAADLYSNPMLVSPLRAAALLVLLVAIGSVQQGIFLGLEAYRRLSYVELMSGISIAALVPCGAALFGVFGALGGFILSHCIRVSLQFWWLANEFRQCGVIRRWRFPVGELRSVLYFSLPVMLNAVATLSATWAAMSLVARQSNGPLEIGLFSAANQWFSLLLFVPAIITQVTFPIMSERFSVGARTAGWRIFIIKTSAMSAIVFLLAVIVAVCAPLIMAGYGVSYAGHWGLLYILAAAACVSAPLGPVANLFYSNQKQWPVFWGNVLWAAALVGAVLMLDDPGAYGLAWSHFGAWCLRLVYSLALLSRLDLSRRGVRSRSD